jgi:SAM-dependent methyltransferase
MERKQGSPTRKGEKETFDVVHQDHLGGCALGGDGATYYPQMWSYMVKNYKIKSVIDIGCGRAYSADYFKHLGTTVRGVEGCREAVEKSFLSPEEIVLHDYENDGPYIPKEVFDLAWSCEFIEHVEERHMKNFFETFKRCRMVALTFATPGQGGHHHVNEQYGEYWAKHLAEEGFVLQREKTAKLREIAQRDREKYSPFYESHFIQRGLFFVNMNPLYPL